MMWKRITAITAALLMTLALACPQISASADTQLYTGDTIKYIFSVGECENIAGIAVDTFYNSEFLTLSEDPEFLIAGQGMMNTNLQNKIKWNILINGGMAFSGEDIMVQTFTVNKKCSLEETGLSFSCTEVFNHETQTLPLTLISARAEVSNTGTDIDEPTDSELTDIDTNSEQSEEPQTDPESQQTDENNESTTASAPKPVVITTTDLTPSEEEDEEEETTASVASRQTVITSRASESRANSSLASSALSDSSASSSSSSVASKASSAQKTETAVTPESKSLTSSSSAAASSAVSSAKKATPTTASSKAASASAASSGSASAVQTAGKFVVTAFIVILAAAYVTVFITKKRKSVSDNNQ